jgi:hypothetical protein
MYLLNMLSYTQFQQASSGAGVGHALEDRTVPISLLILAETYKLRSWISL